MYGKYSRVALLDFQTGVNLLVTRCLDNRGSTVAIANYLVHVDLELTT